LEEFGFTRSRIRVGDPEAQQFDPACIDVIRIGPALECETQQCAQRVFVAQF
jgi:hypothetical protein